MSDTDTHRKHSLLSTWLPLGAVLGAFFVVATAASVWATDRSELHADTASVAQHQIAIDALKIDTAARTAREEDLRRQLDRLQQILDKIADRVGARP